MSWKKIESFCFDASESFLYAGTISGEILKIDPTTFKINDRFQDHGGTISIIVSHNSLPYIATRSGGWKVTLWKQESEGTLRRLFEIDTLNISSDSIPYKKEPLEFGDQALSFHPSKPILATRTGEDGLVEIEFNEFQYKVVNYGYAHETLHIVSVCYVVNSDKILCGTVHGHVFLLEKGEIKKTWKIADEDIHWFEHYQDETYLIANDSRRVIRLDISGESPPFLGSQFARDDFEHITHDPITKRTFASSFDRNIYQLDPSTCDFIRIIWRAPYKCRWIRLMKNNPQILIVQCRNGALYKIDVNELTVVAEIKETPNAIWSAEQLSTGEIVAAGEGGDIIKYSPSVVANTYYRLTTFKKRKFNLKTTPEVFIKRLTFDETCERLILGQVDGNVLFCKDEKILDSIYLNSAVRDLAIDKNSTFLYVTCEDGNIFKVSLQDKNIVGKWTSDFPVWALSLNEDKGLIAVSERMGNLVFLNSDDLRPVSYESNHRYSKRMKWLDQNTLLYGSEDCIYKYDLNTLKTLSYVQETGNSVEDFAWDKEGKYLTLVNYNRKVMLCDLRTGKILDSVHDQFDVSYGVLWLDSCNSQSLYPYEFVTFGRTGILCSYQVYENCILRNGYLEVPSSS